jgi:cellulose synthase/poly-beta-1,6-N-acetylglucosamine synthase-like glycosyltransferase
LSEDGKTTALNFALSRAVGEIVVVSDADCFYERDMLKKVIPYLSVKEIGAISGVKLLLNEASSGSVRAEQGYLNSMNRMKLGESKLGFTPLFEGGFSAYRIGEVSSFDPYKTGSDDCGTIIRLAEDGKKAILVSEASFFTGFPTSRRERLKLKLRRSNQMVRVFVSYLSLLFHKRIKIGHRAIGTNAYIYLIGSFLFVVFLVFSGVTFFYYPWLLLLLLLFAVPKVGAMLLELCQSYLVLFASLLSVAFGKKALVWSKPQDRALLTEVLLTDAGLI